MRGLGGTSVTLPEVGGKPAFVPGPGATVAVALALATAALIVLSQGGWLLPDAFPSGVRGACFLLGAVFMLRAVGEFRLVGFFKRVKGTRFATWDTYLFSPLCLLLGLGTLWLAKVD